MTTQSIFIVGNSRSGTTLLARILSKHSKVHILKETHFMTTYEDQRKSFSLLGKKDKIHLLNLLLTIEYKGVNYKDEFREYYKEAEHLFSLSSGGETFASLISLFFNYVTEKNGKSICGDQTPSHIFYVNDILKIFPDAKFLNIVRDPRAVLLSQKNKWKAARKIGQPMIEVARSFFNYHPITTSLLWKKGIDAGKQAEKRLPPNVFHTVKFEKLLQSSELILQEICSFIEIEYETGMLEVDVAMSSNETDEGKKGIRSEVMNHWPNRLSSTEIFLSEKINGRIAEKEGYHLVKVDKQIFPLFLLFCYFPLHLTLAALFNMHRAKNSFSYVSKKFFLY